MANHFLGLGRWWRLDLTQVSMIEKTNKGLNKNEHNDGTEGIKEAFVITINQVRTSTSLLPLITREANAPRLAEYIFATAQAPCIHRRNKGIS